MSQVHEAIARLEWELATKSQRDAYPWERLSEPTHALYRARADAILAAFAERGWTVCTGPFSARFLYGGEDGPVFVPVDSVATPEDALAASRKRAEAILADPERVALLSSAAVDAVPMTGDEFRSKYGLRADSVATPNQEG